MQSRSRRSLAVAATAAAMVLASLTTHVTQAQTERPLPAALQKLTVENAAFIYVDYVTGLDNLMNTIPAEQYANNIEAFAKTSQLFKMPTLVIGEENNYYGTFLKSVQPLIAAGTKRAERTTPSGYTPEVAQWLRATGRKSVIIGGISIDNCTMLTALDMLRAGYNVYVVADVSSTNSRLVEDVAIARLVQAGAVPVTWLNVLTEIGNDFSGPHGKGMMQIIQAHWPASTTGEVRDLTPDGKGFQPIAKK